MPKSLEDFTPADLIKELGIEAQVSSLVDLIHDNESRMLTADVVRFAMALGVRATLILERDGEIVGLVRKDVSARAYARYGTLVQ